MGFDSGAGVTTPAALVVAAAPVPHHAHCPGAAAGGLSIRKVTGAANGMSDLYWLDIRPTIRTRKCRRWPGVMLDRW
jgi:hypothetical protein